MLVKSNIATIRIIGVLVPLLLLLCVHVSAEDKRPIPTWLTGTWKHTERQTVVTYVRY